MDIIKKRISPVFAMLCIFMLLFVGCSTDKRKEGNNIFNYDEKIQVFFEDASSGKLEKTEIFLSEDEAENLVNSLSTYNNKLSDDILKKEFLLWYTVKLNDDTTLQIDAELNYSDSSDLTYMYVIQHNTEPATLYGTFIDSSIIEQLKK